MSSLDVGVQSCDLSIDVIDLSLGDGLTISAVLLLGGEVSELGSVGRSSVFELSSLIDEVVSVSSQIGDGWGEFSDLLVGLGDSVLSVLDSVLNLGSSVRKIVNFVIAVVISGFSAGQLVLENSDIVLGSIDVSGQLLDDGNQVSNSLVGIELSIESSVSLDIINGDGLSISSWVVGSLGRGNNRGDDVGG